MQLLPQRYSIAITLLPSLYSQIAGFSVLDGLARADHAMEEGSEKEDDAGRSFSA